MNANALFRLYTIGARNCLPTPEEADWNRTPSYIVSPYTLYTACLRAVHILFPGGVGFWFGIFGLTPPVDYSDRPHGIIFSAVADCSVKALPLCFVSVLPRPTAYLSTFCSFPALFTPSIHITSTSYPVESGPQEILSDHLQDLTTAPGTKQSPPCSHFKKTTGDCSSQLSGLKARRGTLVAK